MERKAGWEAVSTGAPAESQGGGTGEKVEEGAGGGQGAAGKAGGPDAGGGQSSGTPNTHVPLSPTLLWLRCSSSSAGCSSRATAAAPASPSRLSNSHSLDSSSREAPRSCSIMQQIEVSGLPYPALLSSRLDALLL